jgi:hypothetical protein
MAAPVPDDYWTFFAGEAKRGHSPLYERLALGIRGDDKLRTVAARVKPGQPQANIILGAVHYLLLGGVSHPLADHYPSVRPQARPEGDPVPLFREFCLAHEGEIVPLVETRVTNTNEVARSTTLYPAFDFVARETNARLHLVEIGPSAGFNMSWDRYHYTYKNGTGAQTRGPASARLKLEAEVQSTRLLTLSRKFPEVASRVGLELNTVNLESPQDRRWLKALIWPELTLRFARMEAAIATVRENPNNIIAGDALELLDGVVRKLPPGGVPVIYHSHVTYQFSEAMRERLNANLESLSRSRPLYRVSIEWDASGYPVTIGRYENGATEKRTVALCDPHGTWLEWTA